MNVNFKLLIFVISLGMTSIVNAQQWTGTTSNGDELYRTGRTGIGLVNPPNDTQLYVKSNNLKVGIVSETSHNTDFQFGILSAVNRSNTKALSVLLNQSGSYTDTFAVFGDGRVRATEVRVKTPIFPDYVFETNYNLMPLSDLEHFILKNKHLPNIPKAEEIVKDGLELGDIQVKQMEKIEELTLYIIDLQKQISSLKEEVQKFKNK